MTSTPWYRDRYNHWYKYVLLLVLLLVYAINAMDRIALSVLLQDIKTEFVLTDTELGLLGA